MLELIRDQRERLAMVTQNSPRRWIGSLRRSTFARNIQGSNSIEGYHVSIDEAIAAIENEPPLDERTETWLAISGYRDALTYIMQAAQDPY
ncbi:MAG TPA: Fic family protein, partial [Alphaproteobacteria bacterium]|nr:Fic family protein [Alphaproteobacteria bacterium]